MSKWNLLFWGLCEKQRCHNIEMKPIDMCAGAWQCHREGLSYEMTTDVAGEKNHTHIKKNSQKPTKSWSAEVDKKLCSGVLMCLLTYMRETSRRSSEAKRFIRSNNQRKTSISSRQRDMRGHRVYFRSILEEKLVWHPGVAGYHFPHSWSSKNRS